MRWSAVLLAFLVVISSSPIMGNGNAGSTTTPHSTGYVLERPSVPNHVLIDQNYNYYSLQKGNADVNVVAFIFTTCPDVCPVITSNLVQAEEKLDGINYQFISITVDPEKDTPQVLRKYMENFGATWPHLTAEIEQLEDVWDDFMISVETTELGNHEHNQEHDENVDNSNVSSVVVLMPDGSASSSEIKPTALSKLETAALQNGWTLNITQSPAGQIVTGINYDDIPQDNSWWWELHTWNETTDMWQNTSDGLESVVDGSLAIAPSSTDDSIIPPAQAEINSFTVMHVNGSSEQAEINQSSALFMTISALQSYTITNHDSIPIVDSINDVIPPADGSWTWQLYYWNENVTNWEESELAIDSIYGKEHIAWAPSSTNVTDIPLPDSKMEHKLGLVLPDGTTELYNGNYFGYRTDISALDHTIHTLEQNDVQFVLENNELASIDNIASEFDLYIWHDMGSFSHWMSTSDDSNETFLMDDSQHYAWVAKGQDTSDLPSPEDNLNDVVDTSTSHSTQTFILDADWKPKIVFTGYDWDVDLFVKDVKKVAGVSSDPGSDGLPGFTFTILLTSIGLAIIATYRND